MSRNQPPVPASISTTNEDVIRLIVDELVLTKGALCNLASSSHHLRHMCFPILFSRCVACVSGSGIPPAEIRPFVEHLTYVGSFRAHIDSMDVDSLAADTDAGPFGAELDYLPALRSITFTQFDGVPWPALARCLGFPLITSINFPKRCGIEAIKTYRNQELGITRNSLTNFCYRIELWREKESRLHRRDISEQLAFEAQCLSSVVLGMNMSAESLTLPVDTAPLARMVELPWPRLRELSLYGMHSDATRTITLPAFISSISHMQKLSVLVAGPCRSARISILGQDQRCPVVDSWNLRSLAVSYPDPQDALFSADFTQLTRLSLRDMPRYYNHISHSGRYSHRGSFPILSSTEVLSILKRVDMPSLTSLELVYTADQAEDEVLHIVASKYPHLVNLELHRYRADRVDTTRVPYAHIAQILATATTLRTVHLNLDFNEDPGPYVENSLWRGLLEQHRGWEILEIMQASPRLEHVAILYHAYQMSVWVEFQPPRGATERRMVFNVIDESRWDSDPQIPYVWF